MNTISKFLTGFIFGWNHWHPHCYVIYPLIRY